MFGIFRQQLLQSFALATVQEAFGRLLRLLKLLAGDHGLEACQIANDRVLQTWHWWLGQILARGQEKKRISERPTEARGSQTLTTAMNAHLRAELTTGLRSNA